MNLPAFLSMAVAVILAENYVLVQLLGIDPLLAGMKKMPTALALGLTITAVTGLGSALTWLIDRLILVPLRLESLRIVAFVLVVAALSLGVELGRNRVRYAAGGLYAPLVLVNSSVLGALLQNAVLGHTFARSVAFGLFAGVGFTLVIVLLAGVQARVETKGVPKAFQGAPIALVTAGLLAMVFMGFAGVRIW